MQYSRLGVRIARPILALGIGLMALTSIAAETDAGALDGAALYQDYCSVCHGDQGDGDSRVKNSMIPPPRDFTGPQAAGELTLPRMIAAVANGRPGTGMPAWSHQLSSEQIRAVVDYVREAFMLPSARHDPDRAKLLYAEYCSVCHGDRGDGQSRATGSLVPPPRDFTNARAAEQLDRDRMIFSTTYGRANTAMPPWNTQLSETDIAMVVDYIRNNFMQLPDPDMQHAAAADDHGGHGGHGHQHASPTGDIAVFMRQAMPNGLQGDAKWGRLFYDANCADCHGVEGDGQGPRAYFILPKPRDFRHPAAQANLNRPHLFEVIAKGSLGTEMAAWDKVLTDTEIAHVTEYVFAAFIRPPAAETTAAPMEMAPAAMPMQDDGHQHDHGHEHAH